MDSRWLRPRDAVARYRVSRSSLADWASRGWIGVSRVGKAVWYSASDIDELIEAGSRPRTVIPMPPPVAAHRPANDWSNDPIWTCRPDRLPPAATDSQQ